MANPNWKKGVSGNPKGRPPKGRALTEILKVSLDKKVLGKGARRARIRAKTRLAEMAIEGLISGEIEFGNGKKIKLSASDWKDMMKWIYTHVDGSAIIRQEISAPSEGVAFDYTDAIAKVAGKPSKNSKVLSANGDSSSR